MNKRFKNTLGIGALVLAANFAANSLYLFYIGDWNRYSELRTSKNMYSRLKEATGRLSFLASLDCTTNRCLQEKSRLENEIEVYNLEIKQKEKLSEEAAKRALVYGYFTK